MFSAIRSTILSSLCWLASGSAMVSRSLRNRTRGPPIAVTIKARPAEIRLLEKDQSEKVRRARRGPASRPAPCAAARSLLALVQTVIGMERANCKLRILFVDQHGCLDFRRGDQLDVDSLLGKRTEHRGGNPRMRAH